MKVWQVLGFKALHFKDRTITKSDLILMSIEQRSAILNLNVEPIIIGNKVRTNHYRVIEK